MLGAPERRNLGLAVFAMDELAQRPRQVVPVVRHVRSHVKATRRKLAGGLFRRRKLGSERGQRREDETKPPPTHALEHLPCHGIGRVLSQVQAFASLGDHD